MALSDVDREGLVAPFSIKENKRGGFFYGA
jgi:hypothetical protein